jgi:hypothetical protein
MELALVDKGAGADNGGAAERPGGGPVIMELRRKGLEAALPLEGLPHHVFCNNVVYEIIGETALAELAAAYGAPGRPDRFILRGAEIPRFVDTQPRLIYQFADPPLQRLLAEEKVFIPGKELSLILSAFQEKRRGPGQAWAKPVIKYQNRRYGAMEISRMMERDYMLLDDTWARREDLQRTGVFPLGFYAGGAPIEDIKITAAELIRRGGGRFAPFFAGLEADTGSWAERGEKEDLFTGHLDFLCSWGFSGGLVLQGHREQARFLAAWLAGLPQKLKGDRPGSGEGPGDRARVLALLEKRYYDLYLSPHVPDPRALLPWVRIAFYEELPLQDGIVSPDLLVLVEAEEILLDEKTGAINEKYFSKIAGLSAGIRLGIFSEPWGIKNGPSSAKLKPLFGIRKEAEELADYLIRDISLPLPLPVFNVPPPEILRPPLPFGEGRPIPPGGNCAASIKRRPAPPGPAGQIPDPALRAAGVCMALPDRGRRKGPVRKKGPRRGDPGIWLPRYTGIWPPLQKAGEGGVSPAGEH